MFGDIFNAEKTFQSKFDYNILDSSRGFASDPTYKALAKPFYHVNKIEILDCFRIRYVLVAGYNVWLV